MGGEYYRSEGMSYKSMRFLCTEDHTCQSKRSAMIKRSHVQYKQTLIWPYTDNDHGIVRSGTP